MALNLLDSVKGLFTSDLVSKTASSLGEGESGISKAISGVVPSILGGIISKAGSGIDDAGGILQMAKGAAGSGILDNLGNIAAQGSSTASGGLDMLRRLLGDKIGGIASAISGFAGIKESSASSLMSMVTSGVLGILGKHASENSLTPASFSNFLSNQKTSVAAALPAGLSSLAGLIGLSGPGITGNTRTPIAVHPQQTPMNERKSWRTPLLLALGLIVLVWLIIRGCSGDTSTTTKTTAESQAAADTSMKESTMPVSIKVKLPDGTELDAYKGGIEDKLVTYLNSTDPADSISKGLWFDFDNLNFKTGSAEITDASMKQVQNLTAILKAYPKVNLKIGGYTDKTGNEQNNLKLSQQRAEAVQDALKKAGSAATQVVGAEGYGSQFAKAAADAPDEERRLDRRISINVRSK